MKNTHVLVATLLALALAAGPAHAQERERSTLAHFGLGTAAAACNLLYGPAKVIYAVLGSATGGLAYVLTGGNREIARGIVQPAVRGDYAVVPENLTAEKALRFSGRDPERYPRY